MPRGPGGRRMPATHSRAAATPRAPPPGLARRLLRNAGVDRAVGYNLLYQAVTLGTRPISLMMMVAFLTRDEQGFQYTFISVLGLRVFFELGLGLVIIQFAGHEAGKLQPSADGTLTGDPTAKARLGSLVRMQSYVFAALALLYALSVLPLGWTFFSRSPNQAVAWQTAWVWTAAATALS